MIKKLLLPILLFISTLIFSQAGTGVYQFLNLPTSSRIAALGGANVSLSDNDINFMFQNPALLTDKTHNTLGVNIANYVSDIRFGSAVYGRTIGKKNYFGFGIQYIDYGSFVQTSETDEVLGNFTAKDFAIYASYARPLTKTITVGATLKPVYSAFERYTSYGFGVDAGVSYSDANGLFSAGFVLKNIGTQLKGYYSDDDGQHIEPMPFNIQLGLSKKFKHAPLRFSFTLQNLQKWDLSYQSTNQITETLGTDSKNKDIKFFDMLLRHSVIAAEFVPSKRFYFTVAYNHRRQKEMSMSGFKSSSGFSFGGGVKISKFSVGFGTSKFQTGNSAYMFSISTDLKEFKL